MPENIGQHVAQQIAEAIKAGKAIIFGADIPDNEYIEIRWSQYGLVDTNEIAVVVTCGSKTFAAVDSSRLDVPVMADRIWGMDVFDVELAADLGDKLWESYSTELLQEVHRNSGS